MSKSSAINNWTVEVITDSDLKSKFYSSANAVTISPQDALAADVDLLIVDSKQSFLSSSILRIANHSRVKMAVDCTAAWALIFDYIVFPNFYTRGALVCSCISYPREKVFTGRGFVIIPDERENDLNPGDKDVLITFGGSDPRFLTRRVIDALPKAILTKVRVICGPGFVDDSQELRDLYPSIEFLLSPKNILPYILASKLVVTAVGSTVNQIEYAGVSSIILTLTEADEADAFDIISGSVRGSDWNFLNPESECFEVDLNRLVASLLSRSIRVVSFDRHWGCEWEPMIKRALT